MLKSVKKLKNIKGKIVILRLDLNVPLEGGTNKKIKDDFRLLRPIPTIKLLSQKGAKVIIIGHLGKDGSGSLKPIADYFKKSLDVGFLPKMAFPEIRKISGEIKNGSAVILENLRAWEGEKKNDKSFSKELASLGDIYVNDAFSASHRPHASIVGIPKFLPSYAGILFEEEVKNLSKALKPPKQFLFILGGAKFSTKIPLVRKYLKIAENIFIGGALANNFFKELGFEIGKSVTEKGLNIKDLVKNKKIFLPVDAVVKNNRGNVSIKNLNEVLPKDFILDAGPQSVQLLKKLAAKSKFVLWNGPLGYYEDGFSKGTEDFLKSLSKMKTKSIVGGGDTVTLVSKLGLDKKFSFVSTGGGAMIEFLAKGTLPGIEALKKSKK
ncbi:MAG: phosphoglycerate kinase [Patescibacteria group bacterium]